MQETFAALKSILQKHAGRMTVVADTRSEYSLSAGYSDTWNKEVWFGGVRLGKSYVSYHLMPVYACPDLLDQLSPELRKRMQGKSCFNFKTLDAEMAKELSALTKASVARFRKTGRIRDEQWQPARCLERS